MELKLYTVNDADNVIGKTMVLKTTMEIKLKRDVDISNPTLILIPNLPTGFNDINYAEIPALNRFYFVNDISNIGNTRWQLSLNCDVLETYKADILASNARMNRSIKTGDYVTTAIDESVIKTIVQIDSDKGLEGEPTLILSTVGA